MKERKGSDLYLTVGTEPSLRVEDKIEKLSGSALSEEDLERMLGDILTTRQRRDFDQYMELNTALEIPQIGRFRVNVLRQRQKPAIVIRHIISKIPDFKSLRLPAILEKFSMEKRGLVLLTGTTGSGKSTTLASMIDYRNDHQSGHIVTLEDPIEFYHEHKQSVITQREIGVDTESYSSALKNALRQRPDVILVGEIRDREVMEQTLTIAETGHLCLATIHTSNAYQAIERIVNLFPEDLSAQVRLNLSLNLHAIVSQRLIPTIEGNLVPITEIMINQGLIRELIYKGEIAKIRDVIEQNYKQGMCSFDQSLMELYGQGVITEETALMNSDKPSDLKIKLKEMVLSGKAGSLENRTFSGKGGALSEMDTSLFTIKD